MKKMIIFEPAMCCSTGICGPSVDPELLRISTVLNSLSKRGIIVQRYNLTSNTQAFLNYKVINDLLHRKDVDILPVTIVDGRVVKTKSYPTNKEICKMLDIPKDFLKTTMKARYKNSGCCGGNGCC